MDSRSGEAMSSYSSHQRATDDGLDIDEKGRHVVVAGHNQGKWSVKIWEAGLKSGGNVAARKPWKAELHDSLAAGHLMP
jgi:hypothetical protein